MEHVVELGEVGDGGAAEGALHDLAGAAGAQHVAAAQAGIWRGLVVVAHGAVCQHPVLGGGSEAGTPRDLVAVDPGHALQVLLAAHQLLNGHCLDAGGVDVQELGNVLQLVAVCSHAAD